MIKKIRSRLTSRKVHQKIQPNAEAFKSNAKESNGGEIYGLLKGMIEQQTAPDVEMETFDGNPSEYHHREVVVEWIQDPKGRLLRLLKYTRGEVHDMIKHCFQETFYIGYTHAQGLLRQRYGDPCLVLASYRKKVRNWSKLTFGHATGFGLFFNFLVKCDGVAKEHNWNAINTPDVTVSTPKWVQITMIYQTDCLLLINMYKSL